MGLQMRDEEGKEKKKRGGEGKGGEMMSVEETGMKRKENEIRKNELGEEIWGYARLRRRGRRKGANILTSSKVD